MKKQNRFFPEVKERAVRLMREHCQKYSFLWVAIESIVPKIGCTASTLLEWVKCSDIDDSKRDGVTIGEYEHIKVMECETKGLHRRANKILKSASALIETRRYIGSSRLNQRFLSTSSDKKWTIGLHSWQGEYA